jgi:transcriptional regulator with XRE-family HTH domain
MRPSVNAPQSFVMTHRPAQQRFQRVLFDTRFDRFLVAQEVNLDHFAAALGMSRVNLIRIRAGRQSPRQDTIARIVLTLRRTLGRAVAASDLFYLGEEHDDHTPEAKEFLRYVA